MSAVASLFNVPSNKQELDQWSFAHMAHHRDINRVIYNLTGNALPEYELDPVNTDDAGVWEYQHQLMHDNQDAILGIIGFDLSEINWKDRNELAGWIYLNALEHVQAANILEIG